MKPLLQNLAEMTAHRDHLRLEVSVLSTLLSLGHIVQVRALEFFSHDHETMLRPRSWSADGKIVSCEADATTDAQRLPLSQLPELAAGIAQRMESIECQSHGRHIMWLPVWLADRAYTCLEITKTRAFTRHQRDVIMGIFLVYQNYQRLLDYSERDALTGLLNRKTFEEQFSRQSVGDAGIPLTPEPLQQWLAVIDIDHFKSVNDNYGHLFGDEVLILVANRLRAMFRAQDKVFRFGGEEFVVLLRSLTKTQARDALERLRADIEHHTFPQIGKVTISIGFTATDANSSVEILGRADQALYYAKEHGRNQIWLYDDLVQSGALKVKVSHDDVELF